MLKFILGAVFVIGLVGYGVLTPDHLDEAGQRLKAGVNNGASWIKEQTDPSTYEQVKDILEKN